MRRNTDFPAEEIYHICNKSIANYAILKDPTNARRFLATLEYYNQSTITQSFSRFLETHKNYIPHGLLYEKEKKKPLKYLAYCVMPDHYHLLIKPQTSGVLSHYINTVENSYSRYFNIKFNRKGPLWQSRFRAVRITSNEQLLHVSRYIHLNPTTSFLVKTPQDWEFSSYKNFLDKDTLKTLPEISIQDATGYKIFCEDQIEYQQTLKKIKNALLE